MAERVEPRYLDPEQTASYISVRVDALARLVRQRRIPEPDYTLGPRSPRWDRLALDATFDGGTASTNPRMASHAGVQKILAQGRSRRSVSAERRKLAGEALPAVSAEGRSSLR